MRQVKELSTREYIEIFKRKKWLILVIFFITISVIFVLNSLVLPVFQASTTLLITRSGSQQSILSDTRVNPIFGGVETVETFIEILKSYSTAKGVAEKLPPDIFDKTQAEVLKMKKDSLKGPFNVFFKLYLKIKKYNNLEYLDSHDESQQDGPYSKEIIEKIMNTTIIKPVKPTNIIEVTCQNNHPELVAQIANYMATVFVEKFNSINHYNLSETTKFIEKQLLQKEQELAELEEELKNIKGLEKYPDKEFQVARLERNMRVSENVYLLLLEKYQEARINEVMEFRDIIIIDKANVPDKPIKPRKLLNMAIGGLFGIIMGCVCAFFLEFIDNTIKKPEDIERTLNLPVLGTIPKDD